jgi:hypothetical protein
LRAIVAGHDRTHSFDLLWREFGVHIDGAEAVYRGLRLSPLFSG